MIVSVAAVSCIPVDCSDTVIFESASPDGQVIVTVFERDCGATTAENVQICLRSHSIPFDSQKPSSFLIYEGKTNVLVTWIDKTNLKVQLPEHSKVFKQDAEINGIQIQYKNEK